ncbi:MAG: NAD-dependent succinate-semialdehyde dehydrogenase [Pseudomonadota bacterium]
MSYENLEMLINGQMRKGSTGVEEDVINPATEEVLGAVPHASTEDLNEALDAAEAGFKVWRGMTALARQQIINKAADILDADLDRLARNMTMEMGKPLFESKIEMALGGDILRWFGEEGKRAYGRIVPSRIPGARQMVTKEPVGVASAFVAWNFPCVNVVRKIGAALGAGCSLVIKPSEETPGTAVAIARAFQEAGLPDGVLNVVFGVPDTVSRHVLGDKRVKKLSFTGSVPVGKHLQKLAADNMIRCTMELGGHSPVIIFDDADVDKAVEVIGANKFRNAGQVCISPTRFYVQENVYDKFAEGFAALAGNLNVGNGLDDGIQMGPLVADRRLPVMEGWVQDAKDRGATVMAGGERMGNNGYFWQPTVMKDVPEDARIMNEEPFGPVAPVTSFKEMDEVVDRANKLEFGLASYVFTTDGKKAKAMEDAIDAGLVGVNHPAVSTPETPFGGVNESGYGSEGGIEGLDCFQRIKFVTETGV